MDFVIDRGGEYFGIEVKFQTQVSVWDELGISRGIGRDLLVTREAFEYGAVPKITLWAFLLFKV